MTSTLLPPSRWVSGLALLTVLTFTALPAQAQIHFGLHGGYSPDTFNQDGAGEGAYMVGAQARFGLEGLPLVVNPGFDYYDNQLDNLTTIQFDLNGLIPLAHKHANVIPYVGAGLAITRVSLDQVDRPLLDALFEREATDYGLNLVGGAVLGHGPIRAFGQARWTRGDHRAYLTSRRRGGPGAAFSGGLLFRVGR